MTVDSAASPEGLRPPSQYLADMFAMNPVWESQKLLLYRQDALNLVSANAAEQQPNDYEEQQRIRAQGRELLKSIQSQYFQMPATQLQSGLDSLTPERHPELAATVSRLKMAADHRDSINAMLDNPKYDRELAIAFGRALTLAPADAGFAKEQYLQTVVRENNQLKAFRSVRRLEQISPALIELERDWFATIRNLKKPWFASIGGGVTVGIFAFVAGLIVRLITFAFESGR